MKQAQDDAGSPAFNHPTSLGVLTFGFVAIVLSMISVSVVGLLYLERITAHFNQVMEENHQMELITRMKNAARERSVKLAAMVVTSDDIDRDEHFMAFRDKGAAFLATREALLQTELTPEERELLELQAQQTAHTAEYQYQVIDLLAMDRFEEAERTFLEQAVPVQNAVVEYLSQLTDLQRRDNQISLNNVDRDLHNGSLLIVLLGGAALVSSTLVAGFVRQRIVAMLRELRETSRKLEQANAMLERKVAQRTAELQAANDSLTREVAERQQAEIALGRSELRYRAFLEHFHGIAFQVDADLRLIFVHGAVETILGYSAQELLSGTVAWTEVIAPYEREYICQKLLRQMRTVPGFEIEREFAIKHKIGGVRWLRGVIRNVNDEHGRPVVIEGTLYDVTERKRADDALRESETKLRRQAEQLAEADRRKDEFLAMLAHELRNPLAPIRNAGEVLARKRELVDRRLHPALDLIVRQSDQMARLVDDLLSVARITQGRFELRTELVNLNDVVYNALRSTLPLIEARKHRLHTILPEGPLMLMADATRLEQVVVNLLANAAKYTEPGGDVWVSLDKSDSQATVRVRDNGIGIDVDMLPRIFEPFVQADRSLERSEGGLGLGLTLVHRLVGMQGGTVEVSSPGLGRGTEFIIRLPLYTRLPHPSPAPEPPAAGQAVPARVLRVLVVDDNPDVASGFGMLLQTLGHEVQTAHDGNTALALAAAYQPDVAFVDIGLPGMDGYEIAGQLRANAQLQPLLLVALTGYGQEEDQRRAKEAGFDHHVLKPASIDLVEQLLSEPLRGATRGSDSA